MAAHTLTHKPLSNGRATPHARGMTDPAFWNRIARKYAAKPVDDPEAWEATLTRIRDHLGPDDRILELGCGTGGSARKLAPHVAHVTASDISSEMIAIAAERQAAEGVGNLTHLSARADAPMPGAPFDAAIALNLLHLVPDLVATLAHMRDQVRPGGLVISKTPCVGEMGLLVRVMIPVMQAFGRAPFVLNLTRDDLTAAHEAAGLQIEEERHFGTAEKVRFIVARRTKG